jgi:type IV secretion system protein VirB10
MSFFRKNNDAQPGPGDSSDSSQNRPAASVRGRVGTDADPVADAVRGERGAPTINRAASLQSKTSAILAVGLMTLLGVGVLTWYYSNAMSRRTQARQNAKATVTNRAQGEMVLPPLGRIDPPGHAEYAAAAVAENTNPSNTQHSAELKGISTDYRDLPYPPPYQPTYTADSTAATAGYTPPGAKTPAELALDRRLSGNVFARESSSAASGRPPTGGPNEMAGGDVPVPGASVGGPGAGTDASGAARPEGLAALLRPVLTTAAQAKILPTQRLLLPKGAFIDCTLETAIDSTLPGMTTCITATDTFGVDGKVVLLERGTKLFGETRGQVQQGSARVFVLWTEARTPTGVVVPLDSPGTDELGRSGLSGAVNRHFWDRFGAAILISMIDGAVQAAVRSSGSSSGTVIYNPSSSADVTTQVLKDTINIPPTVTVPQGDRIQVLVARDLDFRSVYELRSSHRP